MFSLPQSTIINFLKRSAPETPDGAENDVHSKKKKGKDSKKHHVKCQNVKCLTSECFQQHD